jgi:hypothetical protein
MVLFTFLIKKGREMSDWISIFKMVVRFVGGLLLILGLAFWITQNANLVLFHLLLGILFVLAVITLAILAALSKGPKSSVILVLGLGLVQPFLGLSQASILPGSLHWIVHVVHLLVGIASIGLAEVLVRQVNARQPVKRRKPNRS